MFFLANLIWKNIRRLWINKKYRDFRKTVIVLYPYNRQDFDQTENARHLEDSQNDKNENLKKTIQGYFYRFCENLSAVPRVETVFAGVDFNMAKQSNRTEPKDWLLFDTGFVLKLKKKLWSFKSSLSKCKTMPYEKIRQCLTCRFPMRQIAVFEKRLHETETS